jgi:hypothetical protein
VLPTSYDATSAGAAPRQFCPTLHGIRREALVKKLIDQPNSKPAGTQAPDRLDQTRPEASKTQLVSAVARFSKWFGGAKATRLLKSQ